MKIKLFDSKTDKQLNEINCISEAAIYDLLHAYYPILPWAQVCDPTCKIRYYYVDEDRCVWEVAR